ncbi:MAG: tetratricopeptide repeat protein [Treponema sp.]|jgi:hypothetical protein|nr:tetratricopeptide repeat protein [Treponema sp.]
MDTQRKLVFLVKITLLLSVFIAFSCTIDTAGIDSYYITGSKQDREKLVELFRLLSMEESGDEGEFAVTREIATTFARLGDYERLINFLSAKTINNPADPYNSYYFLMIAYANIQQGSEPIANLYFDLIIKNYPDLIINDESIHLVCLRHLVKQNNSPQRQVWYYKELISKFPEQTDLGTAYFMLGQACERVGDWNGAISAYTSYLPYQTVIPGFPTSFQYAKHQVDFSKTQKDWTFESLNDLRRTVENALDTGNAYALMRCQTRVNFFARSWEQIETEDIGLRRFNLVSFMSGNNIRYAPNLDSSSNSNEAFLRTTGWSLTLPTWYLYFRKINFPQDIEIHGRWEWAGIYYGEKF